MPEVAQSEMVDDVSAVASVTSLGGSGVCAGPSCRVETRLPLIPLIPHHSTSANSILRGIPGIALKKQAEST